PLISRATSFSATPAPATLPTGSSPPTTSSVPSSIGAPPAARPSPASPRPAASAPPRLTPTSSTDPGAPETLGLGAALPAGAGDGEGGESGLRPALHRGTEPADDSCRRGILPGCPMNLPHRLAAALPQRGP